MQKRRMYIIYNYKVPINKHILSEKNTQNQFFLEMKKCWIRLLIKKSTSNLIIWIIADIFAWFVFIALLIKDWSSLWHIRIHDEHLQWKTTEGIKIAFYVYDNIICCFPFCCTLGLHYTTHYFVSLVSTKMKSQSQMLPWNDW